MNQVETPRRTWRFPQLLLQDFLTLTLLLWGGYFILAMAVPTGVSFFKDITVSAWGAFSGATLWYAAFIGGLVMYRSLPVHVAHGRTRRDFAVEAGIFIVIFAAFTALLVTLGFLLESGVYDIAGWPREAPEDHLFSSYGDLLLIFVEYWLTFLVWTAVGALIGAAWYQSEGLGVLSLIPAVILVALVDIFTGASLGGPFNVLDRFFSGETPSLGLAVLVSLTCFLITYRLIWWVIRDVPIRT